MFPAECLIPKIMSESWKVFNKYLLNKCNEKIRLQLGNLEYFLISQNLLHVVTEAHLILQYKYVVHLQSPYNVQIEIDSKFQSGYS